MVTLESTSFLYRIWNSARLAVFRMCLSNIVSNGPAIKHKNILYDIKSVYMICMMCANLTREPCILSDAVTWSPKAETKMSINGT